MNNTETLIASWKTTGKDFLDLYRGTRPGDYFYRGRQCGGGLGALITSDEQAIRYMEFDRNGAARVLKSDRPSLRRTFTIAKNTDPKKLDLTNIGDAVVIRLSCGTERSAIFSSMTQDGRANFTWRTADNREAGVSMGGRRYKKAKVAYSAAEITKSVGRDRA